LRDEDEQVLYPGLNIRATESPLSEASSHFSPSLSRSMSASSMHSSPILGNFSDSMGPTSNPTSLKTTTPLLQMPQHITSAPAYMLPQQGTPGSMESTMDSPISWQAPDPMMLSQQSCPSSNDLITVNEFAQKVFDTEDYASIAYHNPSSLDLSSSAGPSPTDHFGSAAGPAQRNSPTLSKFSHRSPAIPDCDPSVLSRTQGQSPTQEEARVRALAAEIGMSSTMMSQCIKQYFRHLYPIMPVIHESTFRRKLNGPEDLSSDDRCLLLSMCAVTILHASPPSDLTLDAKKDLGRQFLSHLLNLRRASDWIESASLATIIASYFASVSYFELKQPRSSNFYVREATGMALEQGLHLDSFYVGMSHMTEICHRRTFALLFVTERGASILRNKPISIPKLPTLPMDFFDDEDPAILTGFQCLCQLFALLDEKFIEVWRSSESQTARPSIESIAAIQQNLSSMSFDSANLPEIQRADVQITQQWLRLIFWQASMRQGIISSKSKSPAFTYSYPILIAKSLCEQMSSMSVNAVAVHGLGIFEKVFEVAYTLMDALTISRIPWSDSEELRYLFSCLSASPNSHSTYVRMLETKLDGQKLTLHSVSKGVSLLQRPELVEQQQQRPRPQERSPHARKRARTTGSHTSYPGVI
jgi:Fungal specific transcription factor domain